MPLSKKGAVFASLVILFALAVSVFSYFVAYTNPLAFSVRLFALNGFIALSIATIITPFIKEIALFFNKPFIRVHHYFAAIGLALVTLHPIALAVRFSNPAVFVPNIESAYLFLFFGGRQALIIIYIALAAVLLRRQIAAYWRVFHALMYVALFFGIVHGNLSGTDFQNPFIMITLNVLFIAAIGAFILKRIQLYHMKQRKKKTVKRL